MDGSLQNAFLSLSGMLRDVESPWLDLTLPGRVGLQLRERLDLPLPRRIGPALARDVASPLSRSLPSVTDMLPASWSDVLDVFETCTTIRRSKTVLEAEGWADDFDRMIFVSWVPRRVRAVCLDDKRRMELGFKRLLRRELHIEGLAKVLLFPPNGTHCKLVFDS